MKDEPRISKQVKAMGATGGHQTGSKKVMDTAGSGSAAKDVLSSGHGGGQGQATTTSKKLIFSFKNKEGGGKQKITPPNVSNAAPSKPAIVGHHRRV